ncbi:protein-glutamate O-methyltransferase CheR [Clostridium sp. HBUAS56017]|uniref:CheR family methyltransferase n=1 Tax=Clostridium sp. HBUAS56017 TaxID=2571128 RepID=UPI00117753BC|nr:protein-glutamate O-methyltransferase CheR [Clostridium sp. HBUAS56017]
MNFDEFHKWVHRELGIDLSAYKPEQLHRRINSLMGRVGVHSLDEYTSLIKKDVEQKQRFLDFITINVTEFFRNPELFQELEKTLVREILPKGNQLRIWSAACSIGCEPYTIGIILDKISKNKRHNIIATDIDSTILNKAKIGEYVQAEVKNVTPKDLDDYFTKIDDKYKINDNIKSMVTFKKHDLILGNYEKDFDLIVCRNVVIYFNNDIKNQIYRKFSESLKKGGLLFVGATESIYNYKEYGFEKASTFIYRKL